MRVVVLSARRYKSHHDVFPIRVFADDLRRLGIDVVFRHSLSTRALSKADVVFVSSYKVGEVLGRKPGSGGETELARRLADHGGKIIWFDSTSTGNIAHPHVLPYVAVYAKEKIWRDRQLYRQPLYQHVLFKDYYHKTFGVEEPRGRMREPVDADALAKLDLAWNISFSDWSILGRGRVARTWRICFPLPRYRIARTVMPLKARPFDISCRVRAWSELPIVNFHREAALARIRELGQKYSVRCEGTLSLNAYHRELHNARIVVSPFGWGEICYRDFECLMAGAVLLKPNMSHLLTWPDFYEPDVTYISHAWDFTDFEEKVDRVLQNPDEYQRIADRGRNLILDTLCFDGGRKRFVEHFCRLLERALQSGQNSEARSAEHG
jgi:hypothetical protein